MRAAIAVVSFMVGAMSVGAAGAQMAAFAKRADGQMTPLEIYEAAGSPGRSAACAPLAVISHGAGGSEHQLEYLGRALSRQTASLSC